MEVDHGKGGFSTPQGCDDTTGMNEILKGSNFVHQSDCHGSSSLEVDSKAWKPCCSLRESQCRCASTDAAESDVKADTCNFRKISLRKACW